MSDAYIRQETTRRSNGDAGIDDLYLRREKSRTGCLVGLVVLIITATAVTALWVRHLRMQAADEKPAEEEVAASTPAPASTPQAPAPLAAPIASVTPKADAVTSATTTSTYVSPAASGSALMTEAQQAREAGELETARNKALEALAATTAPATRDVIEAFLNEVGIELLLSPRPMQEKVEYVVEPGDSLAKLAKKFDTTVDLIRKGNGLSGSNIRAGQRLRIFNGKFSLEVDKSDNVMLLKLNGAFFKRYRVGTGQYGKTPTGAFKVTDKIPQPTWWRPDGKAIPYGDPENLLGTHWLALDAPGYGLHGTWEPDTIGKQASAGCVRLLNNEIEEVFILVPVGTPVTITE